MRKPCGSRECLQFVEQCGGDPESPSEWICSGCGAEGPMYDFFAQCSNDNDNNDVESDEMP